MALARVSPSPQVSVQRRQTLTFPCAVHVVTLRLCTGPCQPDDLSLTYHCTNRSALLSWTPRPTAEHYYGYAEAYNEDVMNCNSAGPTCTIQGLDCGKAYIFSVKASDGACNSSMSDPVLGHAGTNFGKTELLSLKSQIFNSLTVCRCQLPALLMPSRLSCCQCRWTSRRCTFTGPRASVTTPLTF